MDWLPAVRSEELSLDVHHEAFLILVRSLRSTFKMETGWLSLLSDRHLFRNYFLHRVWSLRFDLGSERRIKIDFSHIFSFSSFRAVLLRLILERNQLRQHLDRWSWMGTLALSQFPFYEIWIKNAWRVDAWVQTMVPVLEQIGNLSVLLLSSKH